MASKSDSESYVDDLAQRNFDQLKSILEKIKCRGIRSRTIGTVPSKSEPDYKTKRAETDSPANLLLKAAQVAQESRIENESLDQLVEGFESVAADYFALVRDAVQQKEADDSTSFVYSSAERSYAYAQLLGHLSTHVQFLAYLAQPSIRNVLINRIIEIINQSRFPESVRPNIITVLASDFRYIRFNYDQQVAIIGIPPTVTNADTNFTRGLCILWHEMASRAVEIAWEKKYFQAWFDEFKQVKPNQAEAWWGTYSRTIKVPAVDESRSPEDLEISQLDYLSESFEDLFGVLALGGVMVEALADALAGAYADPAKGDDAHPPSNFRLAVALAFLTKRFPDDVQKTIENIDKRYGLADLKLINTKKGVQADFGDPKINADILAAAQKLAKVFESKIDQSLNQKLSNGHGQREFFTVEPDEQEREISNAIRKALADFSAEPKQVTRHLQQRLLPLVQQEQKPKCKIAKNLDGWRETIAEARSELDQKKSSPDEPKTRSTSQKVEAELYKDEKAELYKDLERLDRVRFVEVDQGTGQRSGQGSNIGTVVLTTQGGGTRRLGRR